jgi:uncharacterized protein YbjT (DUF2867 family)
MARDTILVTGATGLQGGSVARHLLNAEEYEVRAVTRSPDSDRARALEDAGAEIVAADLGDPDSLTAVLEGCTGAFGVTNFWEHLDGEFEHGKNLVDAARAVELPYLVMSTLPSVKAVDPDLDVPHFETKARIEHYARDVGVPATFIHVAFYYENFLSYFPPRRREDGSYLFGFPQGDTPLATVAVEDLGGVVLGLVNNRERWLGATVGAVGDDLPPAAYAEIMRSILGRPVSYQHVPREVFAGFDFPGAEDLANMFEFNRLHIPDRRADLELSRELYPDLQSFGVWVQRNAERLEAAIDAG